MSLKKLLMSFIVVLSFSLTGCMQTLNITSDESDILAEYMADLILKYDKNYNQELVNIEPKEQETDIKQPEEEKTDTEETSIGNETSDTNPNKEVKDFVQKPKTITEVMNVKSFDVNYSKYGLYDSFPKDMKNSYFVLEATSGKKLLVAELKIKNKTIDSKRFEMMSKGISYELNINSKNTYRPIMTLLTNDMQYIDITISGGKTEIGYLVFEIPKNTKVEKADIVVTNKDANTTITLK